MRRRDLGGAMGQQLSEQADIIPLRPDDKPVLFISHRHDDRAIADVLRRFIQARTGGRVAVFQSSAADAEGPKQGENVNQELRRALWHASVLVLIYTTSDQDWSYCMWECGVAQLPEPSNTKTIVFQCADEFPGVFVDQLRVGLRDENAIEKFVTELLTDPAYFPKAGRGAITEFSAGTDPVREAAHELFDRIQAVLPVAEVSDEEWPPYPQLTLELTDEQVERIRTAQGTLEERLGVARNVVADGAIVIGGDSQLGRIFSARGFPRTPSMPGIPMRDLVESWRADSPTPESRWIDALCTQIMATTRNQFPTLRWELMRGADRMDRTWYGPVVRYVKKVSNRKCQQIDVVFCKFELDDANRPKVGVPPAVADDD
jgi:hypothetical protein